MRRVDNQIDVISKTFLGLTVACAAATITNSTRSPTRIITPSLVSCAARGISRRRLIYVSRPSPLSKVCRHKETLAAAPREAMPALPEPIKGQIAARMSRTSAHASAKKARHTSKKSVQERPEIVFEDFDRDSYDGWFVAGEAFGDRPSRAGDFRVACDGKSARLFPVPAGIAHSGRDSDRLDGVIRSRTFTIEHSYIHILAAGRGGKINVVVDGFEKIRDPIYGGLTIDYQSRRPAALADAGCRHVAGSFGLSGDRRRVDRRFRGAAARVADGHGYIAVDEIRMADGTAPSLPTAAEANSIDLAPSWKRCGQRTRRWRIGSRRRSARCGPSKRRSPNRHSHSPSPMEPGRTSGFISGAPRSWAPWYLGGFWKSWEARTRLRLRMAAADSAGGQDG